MNIRFGVIPQVTQSVKQAKGDRYYTQLQASLERHRADFEALSNISRVIIHNPSEDSFLTPYRWETERSAHPLGVTEVHIASKHPHLEGIDKESVTYALSYQNPFAASTHKMDRAVGAILRTARDLNSASGGSAE